MDKNFLMGSNDFLSRNPSSKRLDTSITEDLRQSLLKIGMNTSFSFYGDFFNKDTSKLDLDFLTKNYLQDLAEAEKFKLFETGGIKQKDHLNFWCLSKLLSPKLYVESGVFIGSSLHAFSKAKSLEKIIAIDPNLTALRIPKKELSAAEFIGNLDFSQIQIDDVPKESLVYFDDHINTASRIIQAKKKGFKYLLFDDSTGIEGICQRLYPATPTVPMILNYQVLKPGHVIEWDWTVPYNTKRTLKRRIKDLTGIGSTNNYRVQLKIDTFLIQQCQEAYSLIKQHSKIPDLGEFVLQTTPEGTIDTTKYIIELID